MSVPVNSPPSSYSQGYGSQRPTRKEILSYSAPWPVYGLDWSNQVSEQESLRLAVGSFIEDGSNKIQIITLPEFAGFEDNYNQNSMSDWVPIAEANHQYPVTKIKWEPYKSGHRQSFDLLATTGDYLRLWELRDDATSENTSNTVGSRSSGARQKLVQRGVLANTKANFCAPLTSFDWNLVDPSLVVTSSIDTTCTVWNVETQQAKTQLIAHDREVYDVTFATNNTDIFASVGADGSVRMFDLRALEHSTILYETSQATLDMASRAQSGDPPSPAGSSPSGQDQTQPPASQQTSAPTVTPLLRLAFNRLDSNYLATFHMDSSSIQILDIRVPGLPVSELRGHKGAVNCFAWSPVNRSGISSGSDDHQVFIWEVDQLRQDTQEHLQKASLKAGMAVTKVVREPYRAANVGGEVNQLAWSSASPDWVAVGFGRTVQGLRL